MQVAHRELNERMSPKWMSCPMLTSRCTGHRCETMTSTVVNSVGLNHMEGSCPKCLLVSWNPLRPCEEQEEMEERRQYI